MKRLLSVLFALLLLISCVACGEDEDALVRVTYLGREKETVNLSEEEASALLGFLEGLDEDKKWEKTAHNCYNDYKFETQTRLWKYASSCGVLSDYSNNLCIELTQEQADTLHDILGIPHEEVSTYFP